MVKVIVYGTSNCPYCGQVREYLTRKGVDFTYYDVSKDQEKAKEMVLKTGRTAVPVIDIDGKIITGFKRADIDRALTAKRIDPSVLRQNITFDLLDQ